MQIKSWWELKDKEKITIKSFLGAQNRGWWFTQGFLLFILVSAELTSTSSTLLRVVFIFGITMQLILFIRSKLYWPILRQCIDWEKLHKLLQESKL